MNKRNMKQLINGALYALRDFRKCGYDFDRWVLRRTELSILDQYPDADVMIKINDCWYHKNNNLVTVGQCADYTGLSHITPDDIVIDIGANVGGFTLPAAQRAKHVIAIEPLMADVLRENIDENKLKNITIIESGLGVGKFMVVEWMGEQKQVPVISLADIVNQYGGTILKCDCEGGEWSINPEDLRSIRHIDIEFHYWGDENIELVNHIKSEYLTEFTKNEGHTETFSGVR